MERDYWYPLPSLAGNGYAQSQLAKGQSLVLLLDIQHLPVICNVRLAGDRNWRCCRFGCRRCGWRCGWSWYPRDASQGRLLALGEGMVQASRMLVCMDDVDTYVCRWVWPCLGPSFAIYQHDRTGTRLLERYWKIQAQRNLMDPTSYYTALSLVRLWPPHKPLVKSSGKISAKTTNIHSVYSLFTFL